MLGWGLVPLNNVLCETSDSTARALADRAWGPTIFEIIFLFELRRVRHGLVALLAPEWSTG